MVAGSVLQIGRQRQVIPDDGVAGDFALEFVALFALFWIVKLVGGH